MNMFKRLLIPVDFSDQSLQMFDCVSELCEPGEGEIIILHVGGKGAEITSDQRRRIDGLLESARVKGVKGRFINEQGSPVEVILRTAEREKVTLIAMASSGKGMAREFIVGSTSLGVIRNSSIPVMIDKFLVMEDGGGVKVRKTCTDHTDSAIVPLDFSSCNDHVLNALGDLISKGLERAVLFHVVDSARYRLSDDSQFSRVKDELEAIKEGMDSGGCEVITHVHFGSPVYNIIEVTREFNSSLIVMGTHGKSLLHEMTLGSVSEEVIRKATVSLLIVPCK
jgi:nucleotide-binding universal stress UspA family protein